MNIIVKYDNREAETATVHIPLGESFAISPFASAARHSHSYITLAKDEYIRDVAVYPLLNEVLIHVDRKNP